MSDIQSVGPLSRNDFSYQSTAGNNSQLIMARPMYATNQLEALNPAYVTMGSNHGSENGPLAAFLQNHVAAAALQQVARETPLEEANVDVPTRNGQYAPDNSKIGGYCGSKVHQSNGSVYLAQGDTAYCPFLSSAAKDKTTTMIPTMTNLVPNASLTTAMEGANAAGTVDFSQAAFPFSCPSSDAVATLNVIPSNSRRRAHKKVSDVLRCHQVPTKSHKAVPSAVTGQFTSMYRGVTRHRLTGRYEAHFWDSSYKRENAGKNKRSRGRQVYLGGYSDEESAARTYDRAAIAFLGSKACTNFPASHYVGFMASVQGKTPEEVVAILRRDSVGFARGRSQYRGVTRPQVTNKTQIPKWEARMGRIDGNKYLYLGIFESAEEAARAYDRAVVKYRGSKAVTNFDLADYKAILDDPDAYDVLEEAKAAGGGYVEKVPVPLQTWPVDELVDVPLLMSPTKQQGHSGATPEATPSDGTVDEDGEQKTATDGVVLPNMAFPPVGMTGGGLNSHSAIMLQALAALTSNGAQLDPQSIAFWQRWHAAMEDHQRQQKELQSALHQQWGMTQPPATDDGAALNRVSPGPIDPRDSVETEPQDQGGTHPARMIAESGHQGAQTSSGMETQLAHSGATAASTATKQADPPLFMTSPGPNMKLSISPLAASLLSPLGLRPDGAPKWCRDSPFAKLVGHCNGPQVPPSSPCTGGANAEDLWGALSWLECLDVSQLTATNQALSQGQRRP